MSVPSRETYAALEARLRAHEAELEQRDSALASRDAELAEAHAYQSAVDDVLRVIGASPHDLKPVFEVIVERALTLCSASHAGAARFDGELLHFMADAVATDTDAAAATSAALSAAFPRKPDLTSLIGRAVGERRLVQVADVLLDPGYDDDLRQALRLMNSRSGLAVPILRNGEVLGSVVVMRPVTGAFPDAQIKLLETFAGQAAIAIENVRLFNETREALEQQTATAEVLKVISRSVADAQPVFEKILDSCETLFDATGLGILLIHEDGQLHIATIRGQGSALIHQAYPRPVADSLTALALAQGRAVHIPDVAAALDTMPATVRAAYDLVGNFTLLTAPLLRDGQGVGSIALVRSPVRPFTEKEIALLTTFAAQAVIAIQNAKLFNDTQEALAQQTAVSDILWVTTESPTDVQPVLDAIAGHAVRLCEAASASIFLIEANHLRHVSSGGAQLDQVAHLELLPIDRTSTSGRAVLERRVVHVTDMQAEAEEFPRGCEYARRLGHRTIVVAPLLREGKPFGTLMLRRMEVRPFDEREIKLLRTFGDQAAIALENVRLFNETQEALKHQTATAEVLKVISSSMADTQPVFEKILDSCQVLFDINDLMVARVQDGKAYAEAARGAWAQAAARALPRPVAETAAAQCFSERRTVHIPDAAAVAATLVPALREVYENTGNFTLASAPFLRHGVGVGGIALWRFPPKPFTDKEIALLTTFADQAVIAIENARLFHEIEDKSRQLAAANQHKSDFLANMSHELRTPLNAVIGFSEVLLERMFGELNEKQDDYLKDILSSGKHLLSLISDILDLSKIEAGRMELELEEFDVADALGNTLTLIRERAQQHGIALSLEVAPEMGEIRADQRKLKQIMLNLLSNAVKFTPDGGHITVNARLNEDVLEVAVTDTGIGIAAAEHDAVFQEFRQAGGSYTNKQEGTGLGLALTRRFVELHGGSMRLQSTPGQGSTFTFTIPRQV